MMTRKQIVRRARRGELRPKGLLFVLLSSTVLALKANRIAASGSELSSGETLDHPLLEPKDLKTETCTTCHTAKNQGRFVHTAVTTGCQSCHFAVISAS